MRSLRYVLIPSLAKLPFCLAFAIGLYRTTLKLLSFCLSIIYPVFKIPWLRLVNKETNNSLQQVPLAFLA